MTNTRLTMDELECSLVSIKRAIPMIHQQADHELELCRETCMWIRFLYEDSKMHATALAIASAALTSFRSKLNGCDWADCAMVPLQYMVYNKNATPEAMVWKIHRQSIPRCQVERKIGEIQHCLPWLQKLVECGCGGRIEAGISGTYVCMADALNHLEACLNYKQEGVVLCRGCAPENLAGSRN